MDKSLALKSFLCFSLELFFLLSIEKIEVVVEKETTVAGSAPCCVQGADRLWTVVVLTGLLTVERNSVHAALLWSEIFARVSACRNPHVFDLQSRSFISQLFIYTLSFFLFPRRFSKRLMCGGATRSAFASWC